VTQRSRREIADGLHSAAIHLLRHVRKRDQESGLTPSRLSALSVIVFGAPISMGTLARAEGVRSPTMTGIVAGLEAAGLVTRASHPEDQRSTLIEATPAGHRLLAEARERRLQEMDQLLAPASGAELEALSSATTFLEQRLMARLVPPEGIEPSRRV
jgi:DNA-binding MarR family transcriptional regulator